MTAWSSADARFLAEVVPVVQELSEVVPANQILLVGARCRDLLGWSFGHSPHMRSTNDTDVAVALQNWDQFAQIRDRFPPTGRTGHRFLIAGIPTDVVPFGDIEAPPGISSRPPGKEALNVHGFRDAYERADILPLTDGVSIRIPRPEGYAVLKSHAWLDRSVRNEYKDATDLAFAVYWYAEDMDRLYAQENLWAVELHDFDLRLAGATLLASDMRNGLCPGELDVLTARVDSADRDLLAHYFALGVPGWPVRDQGRLAIVNGLFDRLNAAHVQ